MDSFQVRDQAYRDGVRDERARIAGLIRDAFHGGVLCGRAGTITGLTAEHGWDEFKIRELPGDVRAVLDGTPEDGGEAGMSEKQFYEYIDDPLTLERVVVGLDIGLWHMPMEQVYAECERCGHPKDAEAMRFIIDHRLSPHLLSCRSMVLQSARRAQNPGTGG